MITFNHTLDLIHSERQSLLLGQLVLETTVRVGDGACEEAPFSGRGRRCVRCRRLALTMMVMMMRARR